MSVARHLENTLTLAAVLATAALLCLVAGGWAAIKWSIA